MVSLATLYIPAGLVIGLGAAAPVGPVNLLVIRQALSGQRAAAITIGAGAALADMTFALAAAFGLGALGTLFDRHDSLIRIVGGAVMLAFAVIVWRSAPRLGGAVAPVPRSRLLAMGLSMAVTNPASLLFFVGSFSAIGFLGLGHDTSQHRVNSVLVALSVFAGSMAWWAFVSALAMRFRDRLSNGLLVLLNHGTAVALGLFGVGAVLAAVFG
jgi:putative LysE/RhtB family amino acid efflux pump